MSLINDALKRADEAQKRRTPPSPPPTPPLEPVRPTSPDSPGMRWLALLFVLFLVAGIIVLVQWLQRPEAVAPLAGLPTVPTASEANPKPRTAPVAEPASAQQTSPQPAPLIEQPRPAPLQVNTNLADRYAEHPAPSPTPPIGVSAPEISAAASVPGSPASPVTSEPPEPAEFPSLKLQSIIFRLRNPTVMINGRMVGKGELIDGARVVEIRRYGVTLEWHGSNRVLELPR